MTVKSQSQSGLFPTLLSHRQYSGTVSTLLYNWPIFAGALFFGIVTLTVSTWLPGPWSRLFLASGLGVLALLVSILLTTFFVYDWGQQHEYDRLAGLGDVASANVVIDITCGKRRGSRGLLRHHQQGHYFLIDIYEPGKMNDPALRRARALEPPLVTERRIYQRPGQVNRLPVPHRWADVIYCNFCLHEVQAAADREALFAEFTRVLKPNGRLLIAEHGRDLLNLVAFGPGAFSFFPPATWLKHLAQAGFTIEHHERWRGFVHLWVARLN
ncbi:MAG: methyltransferase domain-containing protein [Chloroflexota bacterium]